MRIKMKRLLSILLSLALVLGLMPGMSMTAHAATYSSNVDSLQVGDILEPGARYEAREKTITLSANGWCTGVTNDEQTTYTQETVPKEFEPGSMNTLTICDSSYGGDKIGAIKVNGNFYFPYANGAKAEAWVVVAVEGNQWEQTAVTLTGYVATQSNHPFPQDVIYRRYNSSGVQQSNGTLLANEGILVESDTLKWTDGNTYVVSGPVTIDSRVKVTGTVSLILLDGASLTINGGIGVTSGNTLNIYAGSTTSSISGTGALNVGGNDWNAGIGCGGSDSGVSGTVNIHGGSITATGGNNGAGIGGGDCGAINIYDGSVTATGGGDAVGIGGGYNKAGGTITIYGGTVNATGGEGGAGIGGGKYGSGGTVSIYGGTVTASGAKPSWGDYSDSMGIGKGSLDSYSSATDGTLTLGTGVSMLVSTDNDTWTAYTGTRTQYMKTGVVAVTEYPLWVGGEQVTSANAANIDGENKASYDAGTNTLALNNYTYEGSGNSVGTWYYGIYYSDSSNATPLTINLAGTNTITNTQRRHR